MQGSDGGWGSFDADNNRLIFNNIPFADHGALLDPSTEDLTGRGLELLGTLGEDPSHPAARRGIAFIRRTQADDGSWYGRWGVNYIYGTWSVLRGVGAIGEDASQEYVRRAVAWLLSRQNPDGGWGETLGSYDEAELAGRGESIPSQTAWALLALFAVGHTEGPEVERRHPVPLRDPEPGRHLGGPALERHGLPPRLLSQVSPVRQVLPALGPRRLSERPVVTGPGSAVPYPLPLRRRRGARTRSPSTGVQSLGRFGRFLVQALVLVFVPPFKLGRLIDRIHFIGSRSLILVILTGRSPAWCSACRSS